jgi:hypothetical protein
MHKLRKKGWLIKLKIQSDFHGSSEVKLPKVKIVLTWVTILALDIWCT